MSAELLVLGGNQTADAFPLSDRATIGTDPTCDIKIDAPGMADFHAVVARAPEGGYRIAVVDGASELVVNGVARREAQIWHGQKVQIGGVEFQLLAASARDPKDTSADLKLDQVFGADDLATIERVWKSEKFRSSIMNREELDRLDAKDRQLRSFYVIGHAATSERSLSRVLERTADAIQVALRPDRLVIAVYEREIDRLTPVVVRRGKRDPQGSKIPVSQLIVRKSAVEGLSVLTHQRREGEEADRPILCVPLSTREEAIGALYLERLPFTPRFNDEDLDFLSAVGRIVGISVERARLERDARSSAAERDRERSRWHAVVQGLRSGVLFVDGEGKVELANPAGRRILSERLHVEDLSALKSLGDVPVSELIGRDDAHEFVVPGPPETFLEVRSSPMLDPDGVRSGAALLLSDVTEEKLRQARLVQGEKLTALGEMLAGVAHEINNPLATILGFAEVLGRKAEGNQKTALAAILEEAERCRRIVSSLLAFARTRKKERVLTDVTTVVSSVLDLLAHELKVIPVAVERDLGPMPTILADRYELQQVFFNVIKNAVDALKATGTKTGKIAVVTKVLSGGSTAGENARVRVEVRDSGPGFPEDARGVLVPRPFYSTKGEAGTGLGLSIAHGIVRDHGGTIVLGVAPEGGASVAVELPCDTVQPASTPGDALRLPPKEALGQRILVVDDEAHVRELLSEICRELGYQPHTATNGREALELLDKDAAFGAILSDVRMPTMDGVAFYGELNARKHPLAKKIIFLSGDLARAETAAFLKDSGRPMLPKPFRLAQVCRALEDVLAS